MNADCGDNSDETQGEHKNRKKKHITNKSISGFNKN